MKLNELKQEIKHMETDYLIEGQSRRNVNQFTPKQERDAHNSRQARGKKNERLDAQEKIISTANGLLCTWFLGKLSRLEVVDEQV